MLRVSDLICARQLFDCLPPACRPQDDNDNDDEDEDDDDDDDDDDEDDDDENENDDSLDDDADDEDDEEEGSMMKHCQRHTGRIYRIISIGHLTIEMLQARGF